MYALLSLLLAPMQLQADVSGPVRQPAPRTFKMADGGSVWVQPPAVTGFDYPAIAMRNGVEGVSILRLTITPNGALARCDVVATAGLPELDAQACALYRKRGQFRVTGRKAAAVIEIPTRWQLER